MQQQGYLGLTYPHPDRLLKILFGCSRGLFFASPVLVAAPRGTLVAVEGESVFGGRAGGGGDRCRTTFCSTHRFTGGRRGCRSGRGTRARAFHCCAWVCLWRGERATPVWRRVLVGLALCSVFVALMVVSTTSQLSMQDSCPIVHSTWPAFWSGQVALNRDSMLTVAEAGSSGEYGAFNLGQLLGLRGLASLIPLLAVWGIAAVLVGWRMRRVATDCGSAESQVSV